MNVETHIVIAELRCFLMKLPSKSNFSAKRRIKIKVQLNLAPKFKVLYNLVTHI